MPLAFQLTDFVRLAYRPSGMLATAAPVVSQPLVLGPAREGDALPVGWREARFGTLRALGKSFKVAVEESGGRPTRILADGRTYSWKALTEMGWTLYVADVDLRVGKRLARVSVRRAGSPTELTAMADYGYVGTARIDAKDDPATVAGDLGPSSRVWIDRNGDGKVQTGAEVVEAGTPFRFAVYAHVLRPSWDGFRVAPSHATVAAMAYPPDLGVGRTVPDLSFALPGGTRRLWEDFRGKVVLIDLWATWCPPCVEALPTLAKEYERLREAGLEVVGVCVDDEASRSKANALAHSKGATWPSVFDGKGMRGGIVREIGAEAVPRMLLVDGDTGRVLATEAQFTSGELMRVAEEALNRKEGSAGKG